MTDKEAFNEAAKAFSFTIGILGVFVMFVALIGKPDGGSQEKFVVEATYGTCAVVKYTPPKRAESVYFLDCGNQHLEQVR